MFDDFRDVFLDHRRVGNTELSVAVSVGCRFLLVGELDQLRNRLLNHRRVSDVDLSVAGYVAGYGHDVALSCCYYIYAEVIGVDISEERMAMAEKIGCDAVYQGDDSVIEKIMAYTGGKGKASGMDTKCRPLHLAHAGKRGAKQ